MARSMIMDWTVASRLMELIHTCYRIGDIDRSVSFYEKLGFQETGRMPIGDEAINVFMNMPGEDPVLELTYNHGVDSYDLGTGYNHIAILVEDLDGTRGEPGREDPVEGGEAGGAADADGRAENRSLIVRPAARSGSITTDTSRSSWFLCV